MKIPLQNIGGDLPVSHPNFPQILIKSQVNPHEIISNLSNRTLKSPRLRHFCPVSPPSLASLVLWPQLAWLQRALPALGVPGQAGGENEVFNHGKR